MVRLEDIHKLPYDPTEDHAIALGLLPPRVPPPSIIPALGAGEQIPKPTPVKETPTPDPITIPKNPTGFRTGTGIGKNWQDKLATSNAPVGELSKPKTLIPPIAPIHPNAAVLPPLESNPAPTMETPGADLSGAMATGSVDNLQLPKLNFKQRQALPTTSEGVPSGSPGESLAELQRMQDQDRNPWGSAENHPGKLGSIAHYLAKIGNIAGNIVAPGVMANIPGTELNRAEKEAGLKAEGETREKLEEEKKTGESERELRSAQAKKALAEPEGKAENEAFEDLLTGGEGGTPRINPETGNPYTKLEAYEAVKSVGRPAPETIDKAAIEAKMKEINPNTGKPFTAYEARVELANDIAAGKGGTKLSSAEEDQRWEKIESDMRLGRPVSAEDKAWHDSRSKLKTLGPFAQAVAQMPHQETQRSDTSYEKATGRLDRLSKPVEETSMRMGRLMDALKQGTPASDALIGPELLTIMAGGQGSGLRMTEAEIARIVGGRSHWQDLQAAVSKWSFDPKTANSITPEQRKQIRDLAVEVQKKLVKKSAILDAARDRMDNTDDPEEHRRITTETRKQLNAIDAGEEAAKLRGGGGTAEGKQIHNGFEYTKGADGQWHKGKAVQP